MCIYIYIVHKLKSIIVYGIIYSNNRNHLHHDSIPGHIFVVMTFVFKSPLQKQLWSWRLSCTLYSSRVTETISPGLEPSTNFT
jgi:hypothetical protein